MSVVVKAERDGTSYERALRNQRASERQGQPKQGHGITYRFKRDRSGWRLFVTVHQPVANPAPAYRNGAIGVDLNHDHVAVATVDTRGDLERVERIDTHVAHKTAGQRADIYRHAARAIVDRAQQDGRPVVIEDLDFCDKRRRLREVDDPEAARRLSAFATKAFRAAVVSRARRCGVAVVEVDPAYTSVIGATRAKKVGITVHQAAAWTIARRALGARETPPHRFAVPDGHRKPVPVTVPADLRRKARGHDRDVWRQVAHRVKVARAERPRPPTGRERRRRGRARDLASDTVFLHAAMPAALGESPGGALMCRDIGVTGERHAGAIRSGHP